MRLSVVAIVMCGLVMSCAEPPTRPAAVATNTAALARGSGNGATFDPTVTEEGVNIPLPFIGTCTFRPDGSGNYNNFLRTNPNGSLDFKVEDATGRITVTPLGGQTWTGTGRVNVIWPSYPTGDNFEATIVGTVSLGARTANATCKDRIANGVGVEAFIKLY
jgi:hypothetical protein